MGNEIAIVADSQEKVDELQLLPTEAEAGACALAAALGPPTLFA